MIYTFLKSRDSLILLFLLIVVGDTLTFFFLRDQYNFAWIIKGIVTSFLLINLYLNNAQVLQFILFAGLLICLGMLLNYKNDLIFKTSLFLEYYSGILFFSYLFNNKNTVLLKNILLFLFSYYIFTILIGYFFNITMLKTYSYSDRFGFMPIFNSQNEFSFIMISVIFFFYKNVIDNKSWTNIILFILALFSSLLVGTKVIYFFDFCFVFYLIYKYFGVLKFFLINISFLISIYFSRSFWESFLDSKFMVITNLYKETTLINALSSKRIEFLSNRLPCHFENFNFSNYFIGGAVKKCMTEMSFFDIFLFFGILGTLLYLFLTKKVILNSLKFDLDLSFLLLTVTLLSLAGGYYFENFTSQIYLVSVLYLFYVNYNHLNPFQNIK